MMKILHVITSLRTGGAEKLMVDLLPILRDLGNDVDLLVFDGTRTPIFEQLESKGISIFYLRIGGTVYDPRNVLALLTYLKRYDIVHTHNTACQYYVALAKKIGGAKCNLVTTEHSTSNRRRSHSFFMRLDKWMYHQYRRLICVSDIAAQNIKDYINDDNLPTVTIANGIDFHLFNTANPESILVNKYHNVHRTIMVAGFRYEKDHPTIIKSFSLLPSNFHLFLVGDGERRNEIERLSKKLGCDNKIHFLGIRTDVPNLLKASDVVIMSSHREGLSLSNLEGMASGRPFVASDVDGLHEIVAGYGLLFPHGDAQALADIILKLSEDKVFAAQIEHRCQERAKEFDIYKMAEKYLNVYREVLSN